MPDESAPWATYADGGLVTGKHADFTAADARIDALDTAALNRAAHGAFGQGLATFAARYGQLGREQELKEQGLGVDERAEILAAEGVALFRQWLKHRVRDLASSPIARFHSDGVRWHVNVYTHGHNDPEALAVRAVADSDVFAGPLDGPAFQDVPAVVAMIAVLDDVTAKVARAHAHLDLPAGDRERLEAALEEARCDLTSAAAVMRTTLERATGDRIRAMEAALRQDRTP